MLGPLRVDQSFIYLLIWFSQNPVSIHDYFHNYLDFLLADCNGWKPPPCIFLIIIIKYSTLRIDLSGHIMLLSCHVPVLSWSHYTCSILRLVVCFCLVLYTDLYCSCSVLFLFFLVHHVCSLKKIAFVLPRVRTCPIISCQ